MGSLPSPPTYVYQLPPQYFTQHFPLQPRHSQTFDGPSSSSNPTHVPSAPNAELSNRIVVLEKELEHCHLGKAEAQLTVQHLAVSIAKAARPVGNGDEVLSEKLARANEENAALKTKLENTWELLTTLMTSGRFVPFAKSIPASHRNQHQTDPLESQDLIDLVGTNKVAKNNDTAGEDTTLLDDSYDYYSEPEEVEHNPKGATQPTHPDFPDAPYIYHFTSDDTQASIQDKVAVETNFKKAARKIKYPNNAVSSSDQHSLSSMEPHSDESSHEHSTSSDGLASSSTSIVTANEDVNPEEQSFNVPNAKPSTNPKVLGVEKWNLLSSFTAANGSKMRPRERGTGFAFTKASLKPALIEPFWKVSQPFSSPTQREGAIASHKGEVGPFEHRFPDFFKYGIRFNPDESERDIYRTVLVSSISSHTTMQQVLDRIRGGIIIDAKLLDTMKICGSNSALIVFLYEHAARDYVEKANIHAINGLLGTGNVRLLSTPTWPINARLSIAINDHQHTRCLEVHRFPRQVSSSKLRNDLRVCAQMKGDRVVRMKMRKDDVLELHFSSIDDAGRGFGMLTTYTTYKGCKTFFVPDPCAQSVETLGEISHEAGQDSGEIGILNEKNSTVITAEPAIKKAEIPEKTDKNLESLATTEQPTTGATTT